MAMRTAIGIRTALAVVLGLGAAGLPFAAHAEDFLSALFRAFGARPPAPPQASPFAFPFGRDDVPVEPPRHRLAYGSGQAWCVRTCDGRYFPVTGPDNKSRAEICNSFCPASDTTLVYGSDINEAVTENGKPYSELPNAFRYRDQLVAGCTCNGKNPAGLARVSIENDPTLRKGDIVAGAKGLEVATRDADRRGGANFTPLPQSAQARYRHLPVVASGR
ncbi:DUF2865 domain-containing protein [Bradyrhizobium sp. STM 3562]|uniref:DUF2865 domain-containing protein n=1 Tax=Bradyrhizobium sp. STM 3562 TaxID=578924 RepID=UPI00388DD24C